MILKKIFLLLLYFYFIIINAYIVAVPGLFLEKLNYINKIRQLFQSMSTYIFDNFDIDIFLTDENFYFKKNDLVNIIICNHKSSIDFLILITILEQFNIDSYNFVLKKSINYLPGLGLLTYSSNDIKLDRKWELDKNNLRDQLDKISSGYLIIFPEGTRYNDDKYKDSNIYSIENNLPIYKNLLIPKSKGLLFIISHLMKNNKLGKIYDFTLIFPDFISESIYLKNLLNKSIKSIYCDIREINIDYSYLNPDIFKKWLLDQWQYKDNLINDYKNKKFTKIVIKYNKINIKLSAFICLIGFLILLSKKRRFYLFISLILSYIIILKKNFIF